jgi:hypothetical protein
VVRVRCAVRARPSAEEAEAGTGWSEFRRSILRSEAPFKAPFMGPVSPSFSALTTPLPRGDKMLFPLSLFLAPAPVEPAPAPVEPAPFDTPVSMLVFAS